MGYHTLETRHRVINLYLEGIVTQVEASEEIGVSISSFKRWFGRYRQGDVSLAVADGKGRSSKVDEQGKEFIKNLVLANPSITLAELSKAYYKKRKVIAGRSVISRVLQNLNLRHKKLSIQASEQDNEDVKKKRKILRRNK